MFRFFFCGDRLGKTNMVVSNRKGPATIKVSFLMYLMVSKLLFLDFILEVIWAGFWKLGMGP